MPRRIISDPNHAYAVELREIDTKQAPLLPKPDDASMVFPIDELIIDRSSTVTESAPEVRDIGFRDKIREQIDKLAAQKSDLKKGVLNAAIGEAPEIVHHFTVHLPIIGPAVTAATLIQELDTWNSTHHTLLNLHYFNRRISKECFIRPTLEYVIDQFENRKQKQEILLYGKLVQLCGSCTTTAAIFTAGATLLPGVIIGFVGSGIRLSVAARSAIRNRMKKNANMLSVNREKQAAILFALGIEFIKRRRRIDLAQYANDPAIPRYDQAASLVQDIYSKLSVDEQEFSADLSALIIRTLGIKFYPGSRDPDLSKFPEFLRLGYHELFNALKS